MAVQFLLNRKCDSGDQALNYIVSRPRHNVFDKGIK